MSLSVYVATCHGTGRRLRTMPGRRCTESHKPEELLVFCHNMGRGDFLLALPYVGRGLDNLTKLISEIVLASHRTASTAMLGRTEGGGTGRTVKIIHSGRAYSSESPWRCRSESDIFIKVVYTSDGVNNRLSC